MFTQKISMDCTKEQYEKFLKDELLKMGYKEWSFSYWEDVNFCYMCNNYNGYAEYLGNIHKIALWNLKRLYIGSFNAPLFLALAAMTDNPIGVDEEYYTNGRNLFIRKSELIKAGFIERVFRKATKEELMARFKEADEKEGNKYDATREFVKYICDNITKLRADITLNIIKNAANDAKEQLDAISLLKSKGYKILKKTETWEEV